MEIESMHETCAAKPRSDALTLAIRPSQITKDSSYAFLRMLRHPILVNAVSFFLLSLVSFRTNAAYLFHGLDGRYEVTQVSVNSLFAPAALGYSSDFIHGLGNMWSRDSWLLPEYFLSLTGPGEFNDFPLAYAVGATILFLAIFFTGRLIGVARTPSIIAAWVVPLLKLQFSGWNIVTSMFRVVPHYPSMAGVVALVTAMLLLIGHSSIPKATLATAAAFLGISYIIVLGPSLFMLAVPIFVVTGIVSLLSAWHRERAWSRLFLMATIPALCIACGYASFQIGMVDYTAANFFRNLSTRPASIQEASLLFWDPVSPFFTPQRTFILLGLIGGAWTAFFGRGVLRLAAISFLATAILYIVIGILTAWHPFWFGPAPWYFEEFLAPFHALFAVVFLLAVADIFVRKVVPLEAVRLVKRSAPAIVLTTLAIAILPWIFVGERQSRVEPPDRALPLFEPFPQKETSITRILKDEIALRPGALFRGRVATLTGRIFSPSTNVEIVGLSGIPDLLAMQATGNMHSYAGLWQDAIPTLLEYNQFMTPAYFVFGRTFFTETRDRQIRNLLAMRRIDPRLLAAVGARFVITDAPFDGNATLRQSIPIPVTPEMLARDGISESISNFTLYLYELNQVNVGQYSPTEIRYIENASEMLDALSEPSTDLAHTAVTSTKIDGSLTSGRFEKFTVDRGFFRVAANSDGLSLLVLPLEYSHCLSLDERSKAGGARLLRVDLLLTGVLFTKSLDARLSYYTGPFVGSSCRIRDAEEMKQIHIQDAFRNRPELEPVPLTYY